MTDDREYVIVKPLLSSAVKKDFFLSGILIKFGQVYRLSMCGSAQKEDAISNNNAYIP